MMLDITPEPSISYSINGTTVKIKITYDIPLKDVKIIDEPLKQISNKEQALYDEYVDMGLLGITESLTEMTGTGVEYEEVEMGPFLLSAKEGKIEVTYAFSVKFDKLEAGAEPMDEAMVETAVTAVMKRYTTQINKLANSNINIFKIASMYEKYLK